MRIGIFDPYLDDLGGGEKYMLSIAEYLSKEHDVTLFWDKKEDFDRISKRFDLDLSHVKLERNIFAPRISLLKRLIETKKFDVIIVLSDGSIPLSLSKKLFIHLQQPIKTNKTSLKNRFKISRITHVFCNSHYSKSYVDKQLGIKSIIIYPPVDVKVKKNVERQNIILHVGRFRPRDTTIGVNDYKKQGFMVKTFKKMIEKGLRNWKFILAVSVKESEKEIFEAFEKEAKNFPIEFLVDKTNNELWEIYSKAKIYWHASGLGEDLINHPEYAEHFGISTVEAMGAGEVPVVINAGGQKEIVEDQRSGFLWDTEEELIAKTNLLIEDTNLWKKMSLEAIERSKFFSRDRFIKELEGMLK